MNEVNLMADLTLTTTTPRLVRIDRHPHGPRVYVRGRRLHHGLSGVALTAVGLVLITHDRHDFPWHLHDRPERRPA